MKSRTFGICINEGDIIEIGVFRRGRLDGFGIRMGREGRVHGNYLDGNVNGLAYSYLANERFGMLAEYENNHVMKVLVKGINPRDFTMGIIIVMKIC